ncbi:MAG: FKBP-type peptidyl-prolyl cis-trans isomerase [Butyricimonas faecihominis]
MKSNYWVMMLCFLASGFIGCSDDDDDNWKKTFEDEQARIKEFVYSKDSDPKIFTYHYTYLKENIEDYAYLFNYQKDGKKATYGDFVWIDYTQKSLNGAIIDATDVSVAGGAKITPYYSLGGPILVQMNTEDKYIDPLSDLLMNIPEGTTGSTIVSSVMSLSSTFVYRDYAVRGIVTEHNLLDYEESLIKNYLDTVSGLDKNNIFEFTSNDEIVNNDTIAKIAKFKVGTGTEISVTDSVTIWIEGYILDAFGTSRKFTKMNEDEESVIENVSDLRPSGLRLAMMRLNVDDEVQVLIPSGMGYGYRGGFDPLTGQCMIPSYSTLLYKIKVIDTKKNPKKD